MSVSGAGCLSKIIAPSAAPVEMNAIGDRACVRGSARTATKKEKAATTAALRIQ